MQIKIRMGVLAIQVSTLKYGRKVVWRMEDYVAY